MKKPNGKPILPQTIGGYVYEMKNGELWRKKKGTELGEFVSSAKHAGFIIRQERLKNGMPEA